ncbi:tRNA preQ1(34) S-adenosylmethionine ribosyltransferase-isomerase QueA [Burkholderia vietnamiensis]|jgi:S-adenosylmethionine:tRNA ribosyltransferase-isomerase|uniref:tRNA preQ1(34) S-adenosylmethionine ribosyltransferase-isomerase QueA n=1 Tax=Burkholderia vietnamiensis TaxID=60552 RepID=UPI00075E09E0|nr:tRNA preQ1(34) S-adenosylmethionine ribosyltransferase-isomerase QueA [Burkholderia vietnamiensis]KVE20341.1 S-adenosylmethionine:tRNA ribosyltransferase-isomerase [Burkholderia vietnamiensis]KVF39272.1 S-adenosylmethionine:tRNA ribosyltransferase-isomerase [Burkholderia vietnamiensis]MBR8284987.1 tRNA preQ1(34) S-adenosylmethionine ribosyltransferase-isomerase QueA [Burkholderia vietnamiensis]MDN7408898.1 tRNA preQ1(34) S-adenosylmethionine ribosyltransferase-isomerase QueA [Burkholderia vi
MFTLSDFDFNLPPELIAQTALPERTASRLLEVDGTVAPARLVDRRFAELPSCIARGDLLVFNDTKVLKARFFGQKASGGKIEVLVERVTGTHTALAQIRASKSPGAGTTLRLADAFDVTVGERVEPFFTLHFPQPCLTLIEQYGRLPLPPYIEHDADATDETRYQTVYAINPGAVAAPTAGLHFDQPLLEKLDAMGVERATLTLHVGAGTFQPVRVENIAEHRMHSEWYDLPQSLVDKIAATRARGGNVIAVGTTSMRALEAAARSAEAAGRPLAATQDETDIFITPGYRFRVVDRLVTNFHLPKSTLLMLVSAFAGVETIRAAYRHAIDERYRFFSYGDAMLLTRRDTPEHA